jgi:hypothetical protein
MIETGLPSGNLKPEQIAVYVDEGTKTAHPERSAQLIDVHGPRFEDAIHVLDGVFN